jgi:hypothetical protein
VARTLQTHCIIIINYLSSHLPSEAEAQRATKNVADVATLSNSDSSQAVTSHSASCSDSDGISDSDEEDTDDNNEIKLDK